MLVCHASIILPPFGTTVAAARELRTNGTAGTPAVIAAFLSTVRRVSVVFLIFSSLLNSRPTR